MRPNPKAPRAYIGTLGIEGLPEGSMYPYTICFGPKDYIEVNVYTIWVI